MTELKVICKHPKNSIRLVKNAIYDVDRLYFNKFTKEKRVFLRKLGDFSSTYFTLLNGDNLDNVTPFNNIKYLDISKSYKNTYVKCNSSNNPKLKENEIYFVESEFSNGYALKFKLKGIDKIFPYYNFYEIDVKDIRSLKLKSLNGDKFLENSINKRKFTLYNKKEKITILFDIMNRSLKDASVSNNINTYDFLFDTLKYLMIKRSKKYSIIEEEIVDFLNMNENILKKFL